MVELRGPASAGRFEPWPPRCAGRSSQLLRIPLIPSLRGFLVELRGFEPLASPLCGAL